MDVDDILSASNRVERAIGELGRHLSRPLLLAMDELPDDVLVEVFALLSGRDVLLAVRCVCRRFRNLALHPDVCRHLRISSKESLGATVVALRLAPCLRLLKLCDQFLIQEELSVLAHSTTCAATELSLLPCAETGVVAVRTLRRQIELGELRFLQYRCLRGPVEIRKFYEAIWCSQLETVDVEAELGKVGPVKTPPPPPPPPPATSSLKRLVYACIESTPSIAFDPLIQHFITSHGSTLESVDLPFFKAIALVPVLANCSNLEHVTLPFCHEVVVLLQSPKMTSLQLYFSDDFDAASAKVDELLSVLKSAPYLKSLSCIVEYSNNRWDWLEAELTYKIVEQLASCGDWGLESLNVGFFECMDTLPSKPLSSLLPRLPRLHTLRLHTSPLPELLEALTDSTAPSLRLLDLDEVRCDEVRRYEEEVVLECLVPALRRLVRRLPELHVMGVSTKEPHARPCGCCAPGAAHSALRREAGQESATLYGLYGHASGSRTCAVYERGVKWMHVGPAELDAVSG